MLNVPMKPIIHLDRGVRITPKFLVDMHRIRSWRYAQECPSRFSAVRPGDEMEIFELSNTPGNAWVKAYLPHTHDTAFLKISGEELALNFFLAS